MLSIGLKNEPHFTDINQPIACIDAYGAIYFTNHSFQAMTGFSDHFLKGKEWTEVFRCSNGQQERILPTLLNRTIFGGVEHHIPGCSVVTKQGLLLSGDVRILPIREENETIGAMVLLVSQQQNAEPVTEASGVDAELAAVFFHAPIPMFLVDEEKRVCMANKAALEFVGGSEREALGKRGGEALHCIYSLQDPRGCGFGEKCKACVIRSIITDAFENDRHHRKVKALLAFMRDRDIVEKTVLISASPLKVSGRRLVLVSVEDTTEQTNAENALRESASNYRSLVESSSDAILLVDEDRLIVSCNRAFLNLFGYQREEVMGESIRIVHPSDERFISFGSKVYPLVEAEGSHRLEWVYRHKDGHPIPSETVISRVRSDNQDKRYVAIIRDMTEWKNAEEVRKRLAMAVEQTGELIVITDRRGVITYANSATERITGYVLPFLQGKLAGGFVQGSTETSLLNQLFERAGRGETWTGNLSVKRKDGPMSHLIANVSPLRDDSGNIINFVCVARDMTHEIDLEKQLRQSQKLEAIGTLAGGIAHDFNNILGAIGGYTELTLLDLRGEDRLSRNLHQVLKGCQRARDLVKQILAFSRQSEQESKPVKVSLIVKEAVKLLRASLPSSIDIKQDIDAENDIVLADPTQIHQIMMNLCTNAAHAMREKGGLLYLSLRNADLNASTSPSHGLHSDSRMFLKLSVSDTGHGIDPSIMDRIFDPFFTTKTRGEGTGMGLSVIHGIVERSGGLIKVESEVNKGTTFHVILPCCAALPEEEQPADTALPLGKGRILLVDDEQMLVDLGKQMLEYLGYEVTGVQSSVEALEIFSDHPFDFDAVVTDFTMPKMNGLALAKAILAIRPNLPIILCTGYSESITEDNAREIGIRQIIMKPVILQELGTILKSFVHEEVVSRR